MALRLTASKFLATLYEVWRRGKLEYRSMDRWRRPLVFSSVGSSSSLLSMSSIVSVFSRLLFWHDLVVRSLSSCKRLLSASDDSELENNVWIWMKYHHYNMYLNFFLGTWLKWKLYRVIQWRGLNTNEGEREQEINNRLYQYFKTCSFET